MIGGKLKQTVGLYHKRTELTKVEAQFGLRKPENPEINFSFDHIDGFDIRQTMGSDFELSSPKRGQLQCYQHYNRQYLSSPLV